MRRDIGRDRRRIGSNGVGAQVADAVAEQQHRDTQRRRLCAMVEAVEARHGDEHARRGLRDDVCEFVSTILHHDGRQD